jgi:hypothetical protein
VATKLGKIVADFTTQLATAMAVGATSVTLQSATDDDGVALPAGVYFFAIDGNNSQKEHIVATLSGTSLTGISSVSRQGAQTSGVVRTHRVGSTVTLTDFAHIKYHNDLLDGTTNLNASTPLGYDGTASISTANQLATKAYVDGVAIAGGADASTTVKGITKMSVAPASATAPIAVGDNDTRVPTVGQTASLVGNNTDIAVGSGNKVVTQTGLQHNAEKYAADTSGSTTAYVITLSPVPTSYTAGMVIYAKIVSANTTTTPTINANSLGAKTIVKGTSTALLVGDIGANSFNTFIYDGTNMVLQSPVAVTGTTYKVGTATRAGNAASSSQTIAHGLGTTPRYVRISAMRNDFINSSGGSNVNTQQSIGVYNGTTTSCTWLSAVQGGTGATTSNSGVDTVIVHIEYDLASNNSTQTASVAVDATNITLTWTLSGTGFTANNINMMWEASN